MTGADLAALPTGAVSGALVGVLCIALAVWLLVRRVVGARASDAAQRAEAERAAAVLDYGITVARAFLDAPERQRTQAFYAVDRPDVLREAIERAGSAAALLARAADGTPAQYREMGRSFVILAAYINAIDRHPVVTPPADDGTTQVGGSPVVHHGADYAHPDYPQPEDENGAS